MTIAQSDLLASGSYYVAEAPDGKIIGCGGWSKERPGTNEIIAKVGHIRHFGVHPRWTRRGVGKALFCNVSETPATLVFPGWSAIHRLMVRCSILLSALGV
jgi:GNAT superfamily N-acetyltransferase